MKLLSTLRIHNLPASPKDHRDNQQQTPRPEQNRSFVVFTKKVGEGVFWVKRPFDRWSAYVIRLARQAEGYRCPLARGASNQKDTIVGMHDTCYYGQAESETCGTLAGGKARLEDPGKSIRLHPLAGVGYIDTQVMRIGLDPGGGFGQIPA